MKNLRLQRLLTFSSTKLGRMYGHIKQRCRRGIGIADAIALLIVRISWWDFIFGWLAGRDRLGHGEAQKGFSLFQNKEKHKEEVWTDRMH
jgi:hypothetical protein